MRGEVGQQPRVVLGERRRVGRALAVVPQREVEIVERGRGRSDGRAGQADGPGRGEELELEHADVRGRRRSPERHERRRRGRVGEGVGDPHEIVHTAARRAHRSIPGAEGVDQAVAGRTLLRAEDQVGPREIRRHARPKRSVLANEVAERAAGGVDRRHAHDRGGRVRGISRERVDRVGCRGRRIHHRGSGGVCIDVGRAAERLRHVVDLAISRIEQPIGGRRADRPAGHLREIGVAVGQPRGDEARGGVERRPEPLLIRADGMQGVFVGRYAAGLGLDRHLADPHVSRLPREDCIGLVGPVIRLLPFGREGDARRRPVPDVAVRGEVGDQRDLARVALLTELDERGDQTRTRAQLEVAADRRIGRRRIGQPEQQLVGRERLLARCVRDHVLVEARIPVVAFDPHRNRHALQRRQACRRIGGKRPPGFEGLDRSET